MTSRIYPNFFDVVEGSGSGWELEGSGTDCRFFLTECYIQYSFRPKNPFIGKLLLFEPYLAYLSGLLV